MKGHIKKTKSGYTVILSTTDPLTGKRKRPHYSGYNTKKEAEIILAKLLNDFHNNRLLPITNITVGELIKEWLKEIKPLYKATTFEVMERQLQRYIVEPIGKIKLKDLRNRDLNKLYAQLAEGTEERKKISPKTIKNVHAYLRAVLKVAIDWEYITNNPCNNVILPKSETNKEIFTFTREEAKKIIEESRKESLKYACLWELLLLTGLRRGEALGLMWGNINLSTGECLIKQSLTMVSHKPVLSTPKTSKSLRVINLPTQLISTLKEYKKEQSKNKLALGRDWRGTRDFVFTHEDGRNMNPEVVSSHFKSKLKQYGILKKGNIHSMRHTWATLALENNVHVKVVSEQLGHSNIQITLDIYSHASLELKNEASNIVTDYIFTAG
jgi:integrase